MELAMIWMNSRNEKGTWKKKICNNIEQARKGIQI